MDEDERMLKRRASQWRAALYTHALDSIFASIHHHAPSSQSLPISRIRTQLSRWYSTKFVLTTHFRDRSPQRRRGGASISPGELTAGLATRRLVAPFGTHSLKMRATFLASAKACACAASIRAEATSARR